MLAARWHRAGVIVVEGVQDPETPPGSLKVRVHRCGICGTDLHEYAEGPRLIPTRPHPLTGRMAPVTLGHEVSGWVEEVGEGVQGWAAGDPVVLNPCLVCGSCPQCRVGRLNLCEKLGALGFAADGGFASHLVCPERNCHPLPRGMDLEVAALVEPLATALHAWERGKGVPKGSVLIVGAGPIGLLLTRVARLRGAERVVVAEPRARRRALAEEMGADAAVDPRGEEALKAILAAAGGRPALSFDCAGTPTALQLALRATERGGGVVVVGLHTSPVPVDFFHLFLHEKTLLASTAYVGEFKEAIGLLASGQVAPRPLVSRTVPLQEIVSGGLDALRSDPERLVKVLVSPE